MRRQTDECPLTEFRCYAPTVVGMVALGVVIAWATWAMHGKDITALRLFHIMNALLAWLVLAPVVVGLIRGIRRHRRHLTRPTGGAPSLR